MARIKQKAYAKINLTLEIVGQADGYHLLDSFVASIDLFDVVTMTGRKDNRCTIRMRGLDSEDIPEEKNNAWKAAKAVCEKYGVKGVDILIDKNIPMGAGLGGSSADVAGVLNGMAKLYKIDDEQGLDEIADQIGSDCRFMRHGGYARMQGRGNKCYYLGGDKPLHLLLLCPGESVSTKQCFEESDRRMAGENKGATSRAIDAYVQEDVTELGKWLHNDLFEPAKALCPAVGKAYEDAMSFAPLGVTMTGAGSCVIAMFEHEEFCRYAKSRYKGDALCIVTKTVGGGKIKREKEDGRKID
jgi:4-diphosphocytidyl-2-C-methyl-D-erythritol kinase